MQRKGSRVKGSYHYLHSTGRAEERFFPFAHGVPTTLRVKKAVDRIYDVRHDHSSKHRAPRTPRLADKTTANDTYSRGMPAGREGQDPSGPDCWSYDTLKAMKDVKGRGKIEIKISEAKRMDEAFSPTQREEKAKEYEELQKVWRTEKKRRGAVQDSKKASVHVPGVDFSKSRPHPSLKPGNFGRRAGTETHSGTSSPLTEKEKSAPPTPHPPMAVQHRPSTPPNSVFGTRRKNPLHSYPFNPSSYPAEGRNVEYQQHVSYRAQDKHKPKVSMARASGRERCNQSKDNGEALERLMKKVNREQAVRDKQFFADTNTYSSFKDNKGTDIWLAGGRMDMAVQGYCEGSDNAHSAGWAASEAHSLNRRVKNEEHLRRVGKAKKAPVQPLSPAPDLVQDAPPEGMGSPHPADAADIAVEFDDSPRQG